MSKEATRIYSTWLSAEPRGYCDLSFLDDRASAFTLRGADDRDECWDDGANDGVLDLELGSEVRSVSATGNCGDLAWREFWDICDGDRDDGNEEREARRLLLLDKEPFD